MSEARKGRDVIVWLVVVLIALSAQAIGGQAPMVDPTGLLCQGESQTLSCVERWRWVSPTPQGCDLREVTFAASKGLFVAVGRGGAITTSNDGVSWSLVDAGILDSLSGVAFGNGVFVAVGTRAKTGSPMFLLSRDGVEWEPRDTSIHASTEGGMITVAWDGGQFVALDDRGRVWKSGDGESWPEKGTAIDVTPWFSPSHVAWTGRELVAVGYGKAAIPGETGGLVLTSSDATTWQRVLFAANTRFNRVAFSPASVVVVGSAGAIARRSGDVWTLAQLSAVDFQAVVWNGTSFLATGATKGYPPQRYVCTSADGATWSAADTPALERIDAFAVGNAAIVGVGEHGACAVSIAGGAWLKNDRALPASWQSVARIGSAFMAVGDGGTIGTSKDGVSWAVTTVPGGAHLHDVTWSGSRALVVGNSGTALVSTDGRSWQVAQTGTSLPLISAVWDGRRFVVAGGNWQSGYVVLASNDGLAWQQLSDEHTPPIRKLEWTGSAYVGIGGGEIHSSVDAVSWSPVRVDTAPCFDSLATSPSSAASSGRRTVVITQDAMCDIAGFCKSVPLVTSDGITWQCGDEIPIAFSVAFNGTQFVAVGEEGTISTSEDGINWRTERGRGSMSANLSGIASSSETTVVVGVEGTVLIKECPRRFNPRRHLR